MTAKSKEKNKPKLTKKVFLGYQHVCPQKTRAKSTLTCEFRISLMEEMIRSFECGSDKRNFRWTGANKMLVAWSLNISSNSMVKFPEFCRKILGRCSRFLLASGRGRGAKHLQSVHFFLFNHILSLTLAREYKGGSKRKKLKQSRRMIPPTMLGLTLRGR